MSAHVDTPTLVLGGAVLAALALTYKLRPPPSQIHPFLLGRQAASAPTRNEHESPVYRSSANGGVRAPYRPDRAVRTLTDVVARTQTCFEGGGRGLWLKGGDKLLDVVTALRAGLVNALASTPGRVLVAVEDPTGPLSPHPLLSRTHSFAHSWRTADALLVTLALATSQHKPIVIAPGSAVPADLDFAAVVRTQNALPANFTAAKVINLDEADREDAQELLATGKQLVADGKDGAASAGDAGDLALSLVSEGIRLDLTNQVRSLRRIDWLRQRTHPLIAESHGVARLVDLALPAVAQADQADHQGLCPLVPPPFHALWSRPRPHAHLPLCVSLVCRAA